MKKLITAIVVVLCVISLPLTSFAFWIPSGTQTVDRRLDTAEVSEIRFAESTGCDVKLIPATSSATVTTLDPGTVLYVDNIFTSETDDDNNKMLWCKAKIDDSGNYYYIDLEETTAVVNAASIALEKKSEPLSSTELTSIVDTGDYDIATQSQTQPTKTITNDRRGTYKITYYCSACNSPRGTNRVKLAGSHAYIGSCASNSFPLGSTIYVEGVGNLYVNDRMGRKGKVDIYRGDMSSCNCNKYGTFRAEAWIVG